MPIYRSTIPAPVPYSSTRQPSDQTGLYFQDQIKLAKKIVATLSGREDWTQLTTSQLLFSPSTTVQSPSAFTGRAGLAYLSDLGLAPYVSYSTSFLPTSGVNYYGVPFKPTTGKQIETGPNISLNIHLRSSRHLTSILMSGMYKRQILRIR
jgi:iron complex outermembrane recepter protein